MGDKYLCVTSEVALDGLFKRLTLAVLLLAGGQEQTEPGEQGLSAFLATCPALVRNRVRCG